MLGDTIFMIDDIGKRHHFVASDDRSVKVVEGIKVVSYDTVDSQSCKYQCMSHPRSSLRIESSSNS